MSELTQPVEILLAEDNEDDIVLTQEAFTEARWVENVLHVVRDGEEALAYLRRQGPYQEAPRPGLVLLDINMPKKNGFEVLQELKTDPEMRSLPVVMLTTSMREEDVLRSYTEGACSFISKPVRVGQLQEVLKQFALYWVLVAKLPALEVTPMRVLLVEDNPDHAVWIGELLAAVRAVPIELTCADRLSGAFARLAEGGIDVVLLDLTLPDSHGLNTVASMCAQAPWVPFVVLTVLEDEDVGVKAVQMGAQDYLLKSRLDGELLHRALRYAIERRQADEALQAEHRLLQSVVESMDEGLVVADTGGNFLLFNAAATRILGAGATDEPPEKWAEHYGLYLPDTVTLCPAAALPLVSAMRGETVSGVELFLRHPRRAEEAWLSGTATPLKDRAGVVQGGVAVFRDVTAHKQAERDKAQILAARAVQQKLFPSRPPQVAGYDLAGAAYPAEATSGDYFDFVPLADGCLGVVIGDVSGHGLGPALLMAQTRTCLRTLAKRHTDVGEILTLANRMIAEDTVGDPFVTLFFGRLDPRTHTFVYAGAGHQAYLFPAGGEARRLDATGPPLGIVPDVGVGCSGTIQLNPGDLLLLATDGIWEAPSPDGSPFGIARVVQTIARYRKDSAQELVNDLYHTVRAFSQYLPQQDDITAVVMRRLPL